MGGGEGREGMDFCVHREGRVGGSLDMNVFVLVQIGIVISFVGGRIIYKVHESGWFRLVGVQRGIRALGLKNYGY